MDVVTASKRERNVDSRLGSVEEENKNQKSKRGFRPKK